MKIKLKCGDVYNTEKPPFMQRLSEEGIEEMMELWERGIKNETHLEQIQE